MCMCVLCDHTALLQPLSPRLLLGIIRRVASVLQELHAVGIVHSNLRAANVWVGQSEAGDSVAAGSQPIVTLSGYQHWTRARPAASDGSVTIPFIAAASGAWLLVLCPPACSNGFTSLVIAIAAWTAPEALPRVEKYTESAPVAQEASLANDVHMLGSLMYECMTGNVPWHWYVDPLALLKQRCALAASPLSDVVHEAASAGKLRWVVRSSEHSGVIAALMALMRRCLSTIPAERPRLCDVCTELSSLEH